MPPSIETSASHGEMIRGVGVGKGKKKERKEKEKGKKSNKGKKAYQSYG